MDKEKIRGLILFSMYMAFFWVGYFAGTKNEWVFSLGIFAIAYFLIFISKRRRKHGHR